MDIYAVSPESPFVSLGSVFHYPFEDRVSGPGEGNENGKLSNAHYQRIVITLWQG